MAHFKDLRRPSSRAGPTGDDSAKAARRLVRAALVAIASFQLGACAAVNPDILASGASRQASEVVVLAPGIIPGDDVIAVLTADEEARRFAAIGGPAAVPAFAPTATAAPPPSPPDREIAVISADEEPRRLAQAGPPPPSSYPVIQGQPVVGEGEGYDGYGYGYGAPRQRHHEPAYVDEGDPFEPLNRAVFAFNNALDTVILEPLARTYRFVMPQPVRVSVRNFLSNLESPVTFANDMMQGEISRAEVTAARFMFNTTFGVAGLHDFAAEIGLDGHREDFDQTLAVYGVPSGPYLVAPILGPATPRHLVGRAVDSVFHPLTWALAGEPVEVVLIEQAVEGVVAREEVLDAIEETKANSVDYYVAIQSFYRQKRMSEINNGRYVAEEPGGEDPYASIDQY